jgi:hypothetical protein
MTPFFETPADFIERYDNYVDDTRPSFAAVMICCSVRSHSGPVSFPFGQLVELLDPLARERRSRLGCRRPGPALAGGSFMCRTAVLGLECVEERGHGRATGPGLP